ncbi:MULTISPECIES: methyl-accepting chemotaxis protein [Paraburkholderia]|uniref:methyl-accepting chemotaxis protein n=1 Tax=Paraburkholderia TaxID=1822464 RepID=UPI00225989D2|nr:MULTISPECIES: methyl-accepting chemotaxis protein [Paraburkholderia]MCX4153857.1 methyl-accepting chemotaxis protein [Paraburkholderia aspalathi]MDN7163272.1 methyl-accepting chemotaxis protein [Paraburkholderia sp. SECH2]MDQ6391757.1 methyl-accepting chemotaxis protein [Paraburkholderia aspalathi]
MNKFIYTIRFKIIVVLGACITLMAVMGVMAIVGLARLNSNMSETYGGTVVPLAQISEVRAAQLNIRVKLRRIQIEKTPATLEKMLPIAQSELATIDKVWPQYYPAAVSNPTEREAADRADRALKELMTQTGNIITLLKAGKFDAASDLINSTASLSDALNLALSDDTKINVLEAKQFADDGESTYKTLLMVTVALLSTGVLIAGGMSIYLMRVITRPLDRAVNIANRIAEGKLENRITVDIRGEFGLLLDALKTMDGKLSNTVRGIKASAESVTVASREIASGNLDLSARTEEQAASLEETAASMTQLTETVRQNADNARQANTLASGATDMAHAGNQAVQDMVASIGRISESSSKIRDITSVIEGIAFQTNILALNAAVEAARAGEQGRGFAVVASEVRSLAQRSATAAREIKELISTSVAMIQGGSKQATDVGVTIGQVKQAIRQVADIVGEIAAASEEQSRGIEQVNQAVTQMDDVTQQNAALVEQAAAAAQSLEEQSSKLLDAVLVFSTSDTESTRTPARAVGNNALTVRRDLAMAAR